MPDYRKLIRNGLENRRWKPGTLARHAGVSRIVLNKYLSGRVDVTTTTLSKLLDALERSDK